MMVVNFVWVQPDRSPFHSAPIALMVLWLPGASSVRDEVRFTEFAEQWRDRYPAMINTWEGS
jgi:hypothetical protein